MGIPYILDPLLPVELITAAALVAGAGAVVAYARSPGVSPVRRLLLGAVRLLAIGLVAAILLRPMRPAPEPAAGLRPVFPVLVDVSASMNTRDADGEATRFEAIVRQLKADAQPLLGGLAEACDVRVFEFSDSLRAVRLRDLAGRTAADGARTDLAAALAAAARVEPGRAAAGALLISDGRDNGGGNIGDAALALKGRQMPVWTVCVGTPLDVKDVYVTARLSRNFLYCGQPGALDVVLSQSGYDQWHVNVHLYREGRYVATRQAVLKRGTVHLEFPVTEEVKGLYKYRVEVDPLPGEGDALNNGRTLFARVVEERTKILVVDSRPHWDSKFLLRVLQHDPNLEVTSLFYLTPDKIYAIRDGAPSGGESGPAAGEPVALPRTRRELDAYDCLILGRDMDALLQPEELRLVADYIADRGGSVVFFRGRASSESGPLDEAEPVEWTDEVLQDVRLELTPEGRASPVFSLHGSQPPDVVVRELPGLTSVTRVEREKSLAVVLAVARQGEEAQPMAALAYQRYGKGKVMTVAAAGLWRWAFMPPSADEYRDVYERFWRQAIQWLVFESDFLPGQDVSFSVDSSTYQPGQRVRLGITTRHVDPAAYSPRITVEPPAGPALVLAPDPLPGQAGTYAATFMPEQEGEYRAVLRNNVGKPEEDEARFTVYADQVETRLVASDAAMMDGIAAATGGEPIPLESLRELPAKVRRFGRQASEKTRPVDAWDRLAVFGALAALLALEWYGRKRWGML